MDHEKQPLRTYNPAGFDHMPDTVAYNKWAQPTSGPVLVVRLTYNSILSRHGLASVALETCRLRQLISYQAAQPGERGTDCSFGVMHNLQCRQTYMNDRNVARGGGACMVAGVQVETPYLETPALKPLP